MRYYGNNSLGFSISSIYKDCDRDSKAMFVRENDWALGSTGPTPFFLLPIVFTKF